MNETTIQSDDTYRVTRGELIDGRIWILCAWSVDGGYLDATAAARVASEAGDPAHVYTAECVETSRTCGRYRAGHAIERDLAHIEPPELGSLLPLGPAEVPGPGPEADALK